MIRHLVKTLVGRQSDEWNCYMTASDGRPLRVSVKQDGLSRVWVADCLDLPDCYALGWNEREARYQLRDTIREVEARERRS